MSEVIHSLLCTHCGELCDSNRISNSNGNFCCLGCKSVYEILSQNNLCEYYSLNENPGIKLKSIIQFSKFNYLDNPVIAQKIIDYKDETSSHVRFYLPQIHCSSCLWLLERLSQFNENISSSRIHLFEKEIQIVFNHNLISLKEIVTLLASIGYEPLISLDTLQKAETSSDNQLYGLKIGVAGFCFGNIMLMSLAEYFAKGQMEPIIHRFIGLASIVLALPTLFYSASVFYNSAWNGLKNRILNIDTPIVLAIAITFSRSIFEILSDQGIGYLDSMSGIIFFMLISRWFQSRTYRKTFYDKDFKSFFPINAKRLIDGFEENIELKDLKLNDTILIQSHEMIPIDGILTEGKAFIDYSFVTGESRLVSVQKGEMIFAGGRQEGGNIEVKVTKEFIKGKLVSLWNNPAFRNEGHKKLDEFDRIANWFTLVVLALGLSAGIYWALLNQSTYMWNAMITVLIVACPCALLLAKNFSHGYFIKTISNHGFFLRNTDIIKKFNSINTIVFDKTGTLTEASPSNITHEGKPLSEENKTLITSVLKQSSHPLCLEVLFYLKNINTIDVEHFKEIPGKGIEAWIMNKHIKLGSAEFIQSKLSINKETSIYYSIDGIINGRFMLQASYKTGLQIFFEQLNKYFKLILLSGDNSGDQKRIKEFMGKNTITKFNQSPQDKLSEIKNLQNEGLVVMMIGDGLNDAGAFKQSDLGICISNNNNGFTPACDAILDAKHFSKLPQLIQFLRKAKGIILAVFCFSALYNIIGLYFALQGILSPLIAAILMPLSSMSILLLSFTLTEWAAYRAQLTHQQ